MEIRRIDGKFYWFNKMKLIRELKWFELPLIAWHGFEDGYRIL
jgi:hypothetical protein